MTDIHFITSYFSLDSQHLPGMLETYCKAKLRLERAIVVSYRILRGVDWKYR